MNWFLLSRYSADCVWIVMNGGSVCRRRREREWVSECVGGCFSGRVQMALGSLANEETVSDDETTLRL